MKNSKGISLIALIITIIVIIILAAIVIGGVFNTPNDAKFANFCQEYDRVQTAIRLKYYELYQKYALKASTEIPTHYEIYNEIATGTLADSLTGNANIDSDHWVEIASTQWGTARSKLCAKPSVNGEWYLRLNDGKLAYQGFEKAEKDMYYTPTAHVTGSRAQISADILNALTAENAADSSTQSGLGSLLLSSASTTGGGATAQWTLTDNDSDEKVSYGDIVTPNITAISSERFYVVDVTEGGDVVLLAEYQVNPSTDRQDSTYTSGQVFDSTSPYSNVYAGSDIEGAVNSYAESLSDEGLTINSARLLLKDDLEKLNGGTALSSGSMTGYTWWKGFLKISKTYWLGSPNADNTNYAWYVNIKGSLSNAGVDNAYALRPVIIVSESLISQ